MRDERFNESLPDDPRVAAALQALPLAAPSRSAWPEVAAALAARRRAARKRWLLPAFASAAVLALAIGFVLRVPAPQQSQAGVATAGSEQSPTGWAPTGEAATSDSSGLIARNRELEMMLRGIDPGSTALDGQAAMASAQLEDLIGMLDLELSQAHGSERAHELWQQRLVLLQELASVRQIGFASVAQQDNAASPLHAATYVVD